MVFLLLLVSCSGVKKRNPASGSEKYTVVDPCQHATYGIFPVCFGEITVDRDKGTVSIASYREDQRKVFPTKEFGIVSDGEELVAVDKKNISHRVVINKDRKSGRLYYSDSEGELIYEIIPSK